MKRIKKLKFIVSIFLAITLISVPFAAMAKSPTMNSITPQTVVTKDNLYDVLSYLNISSDSCKVTYAQTSYKKVTVQEFKEAYSKIKAQNNISKTISNSSYYRSKPLSIVADEADDGGMYISHSHDFDGYTLNFSCFGLYSEGSWIGVTSGDVNLSDDYISTVTHKIDSKNIDCSCASDVITMHSTVVVGSYIGIDFALIEFGSVPIDSTNYFYASDYPLY